MKQVTVSEARKILGDEAVKMSDDEVQRLIDDLFVMAKWALEESVRIRNQGVWVVTNRGKNHSAGV